MEDSILTRYRRAAADTGVVMGQFWWDRLDSILAKVPGDACMDLPGIVFSAIRLIIRAGLTARSQSSGIERAAHSRVQG